MKYGASGQVQGNPCEAKASGDHNVEQATEGAQGAAGGVRVKASGRSSRKHAAAGPVSLVEGSRLPCGRHGLGTRPGAWCRVGVATRKAVSQVRDVVVEALDPIEIILFGSVAQTALGNDLDLVVVTEDGDGAPRNIGLVS